MNDILNKLHEAAASPRAQMDGYLAQGKKIVLCAPVYTPEELIHAMGFVPMGAWGGDVALNRAKEYCPAFLCAIVQSLLELGINGAYKGASAIVIPSLCDTLKTVGENWKYAVPSIPFIPMTYPQNRKPAYGVAYTKAGYERVIRDLEKLGGTFSEEKLLASIKIYNRHNAAMRKIDQLLAGHPEITAAQRSDIFKSAFFMTKEEHTDLVEALIAKLEAAAPAAERRVIPLYTSPAAAGFAAPVFGEDYELIPVTGDVPPGAELAVRIQGDSMAPVIADGAVVYVNHDPVQSGDVGIFCVDGDMLCKQYYRDPLGMVYLFSLNRKRADMDVVFRRGSGRSLTCFGRAFRKNFSRRTGRSALTHKLSGASQRRRSNSSMRNFTSSRVYRCSPSSSST